MKYFTLALAIFFLSTFYIKAQDSTAVIKSYEQQIQTGKVVKKVGRGLLIASPVLILGGSIANIGNESNLIWVNIGVATLLVSIPIFYAGKYTENYNKRALRQYRLRLGTTGSIPTIGINYQF